jgi:hypothetical protein
VTSPEASPQDPLRYSYEAFYALKQVHARALKRLRNARKVEDCLRIQSEAHRPLIGELLNIGLAPDDIANILLEKWQGPVNRRKIVSAIQRCDPRAAGSLNPDGAPRKRIGRPPKNAAAAEPVDKSPAAPAAVADAKTPPVRATPKRTLRRGRFPGTFESQS